MTGAALRVAAASAAFLALGTLVLLVMRTLARGQMLAEKYVIRSKWKRNKERGPIPEACVPREVVQMDSMDFDDLYAFTAIDLFTREADILVAPELTANYGAKFLFRSMRRRFSGHVHLIQTDGGPEFKADFLANVALFCDRHRVARPYRKNEQSYIESFNRTVRKECLGWHNYRLDDLEECTNMVESFLARYHYHRPHMGLGMKSPPPPTSNQPPAGRPATDRLG